MTIQYVVQRRIRSRFSVIIPTYQRRALVVLAVQSLEEQTFPAEEVIVVVDGSEDGSAEALRRLTLPFKLIVVEQPNRGAAAARNRGAEAAGGEILLFLDDDMEADPRLLAEHDRTHRDGADVVLGHIPLHPDSPPNLLSAGVRGWAERRCRRLSTADAQLTLHDLLTGQISVRRAVFEAVAGFDGDFTRRGTFGNEDVDFGYRLLDSGFQVRFNPHAISRQRYLVPPHAHLRQWHQAGCADVLFARKHPEVAAELFALNGADRFVTRWVWQPLAAAGRLSAPVMAVVRWLAILLATSGARRGWAVRLFFEARSAEYWRGVRDAGGVPRSRVLRVLAWHSISTESALPESESYTVSQMDFRRQLDLLLRWGFHVVSSDEFLHFLRSGGGLPRRAVLLTFDDCYEDLQKVALPILAEQALPAVAFAVTAHIGGTNRWDHQIGGRKLRLLDVHGLRELEQRRIEIGAHSRTHRSLPRLPDGEIAAEVEGSANDLEAAGLRRPRLFAYPYGELDARVERAVEAAGLLAAFTVEPGRVRAGAAAFRLPRIEIGRHDASIRFLLKVILARDIHKNWRSWRQRAGRWRRRRFGLIGRPQLPPAQR